MPFCYLPRFTLTSNQPTNPLSLIRSQVPFWTIAIAIVMGNCVILKPSEKVPLTMQRVAQLMVDAGVPKGVFQVGQHHTYH